MSEFYTCGHKATFNSVGDYLNGTYATWIQHDVDWMGDTKHDCYGVLCYDCFPLYEATPCRLGGEPLE